MSVKISADCDFYGKHCDCDPHDSLDRGNCAYCRKRRDAANKAFGICDNAEKAKEIFREYLANLKNIGDDKLFSPLHLKEMREALYDLGYVITYGIHSHFGDKLILAKIEMKQD